jgi:osmoprotectant transport system ATP-binding protein
VIKLDGVRKSYGSRIVLAETSLEVAARTCLALIGPSGSGKSTLLRVVVGLVIPDAGRVTIGGEPMTPATARELRRRIGYVIQDGGLFPHLTARGNVTLVARQLGWNARKMDERVEVLRELTQLGADAVDRYPAQLSGGQRQRVGLMRALMLDPDVLLMDEPLGALDPMIRSKLQEDLREIFRRLNKTVLFVTHDMGEAAYLGDEITLMKDGQIVQRGTIDDLAQRPASGFVSEFLAAQRPLAIAAGAGAAS